uniref:HTH_11 domain-containing protein n=1 Tax=Globodera pallida TaxID=36090 RepID=A0A183CKE9_GLOPA
MRALLYLLTLTLGCFLENGYCVKKYEVFKSNADAVALAEQYENDRLSMMEFHQQLNGMGFQQSERTIRRYIDKLKKEGIISSGQAPNSNPSFTVDYQHGVNSYTHDDTTPYGQASNSNPSSNKQTKQT